MMDKIKEMAMKAEEPTKIEIEISQRIKKIEENSD